MRKSVLLIISILLILLGCHSTSKEDQYNNMNPKEIYQQGVQHVTKKHYTDAVDDFLALESRYPFGDYADKAQLGAIYALYLGEDYPSALPAVERFIRMYPRHPNVDYAYYIKGLIYFSESLGYFTKYLPMEREERDPTSPKKAFAAFSVLIIQYPHSVYVQDAKQRMIYLRNLIAENELVAARFYMRKGAYLAAANRANSVIAQFDQSPSIPEALRIMRDAYRELNLNDLANDADRVLALNYPDLRGA